MDRSFIIRLVISIVLLSLIIYFIGWGKIEEALLKANLKLILIAIIIENLGVFITSKRWQIMLKIREINVNYRDAVAYYFIGTFFNAVMPSSIGGDIIKAYKLGRKISNEEAFASVFMDRLMGLIALLLIVFIIIFVYHSIIPYTAIWLSIFFSLATAISLLFLIKTKIPEKIIEFLFKKWEKAKEFFLGIVIAIKNYKNRNLILKAFIISLFYQLILIFNNYILALALGIKTSLVYFFIFIPIAEILVVLPITIRGFGIRESTYAILFSSVGVDYAKSFSMGFLNQLVKVSVSIVGGIIHVLKS